MTRSAAQYALKALFKDKYVTIGVSGSYILTPKGRNADVLDTKEWAEKPTV